MNNFVHLHTHTEYSLLDGASRIKKLIATAKDLQMPAIAITDHGVMYGAIDFYKEAKKQGIKPIIGCELYITPTSRHSKNPYDKENAYHIILLAENNIGYQNLIKLVSIGHLEGFYYKPRIDREILREYSEGIICLSACIAGEVPAAILSGDYEKAQNIAQEYIDIFGRENFFIEIQNHGMPEEIEANIQLRRLAVELNVGLAATNDIHYVRREDSEAQDILLCVQTARRVNEIDRMKFPNDEFYLKSYEEMADLFPDDIDALENTVKIAERCNVDIQLGKLLLPEFEVPEGMSAGDYLRNLCEQALPERYSDVNDAVRERLEFELKVIHDMGYESYFLIVWDFIDFARREGILVGPGRGSAAGSIVSYLLKITNLDPIKHKLLFERFLNPERVSMPDIDIDFCYERRQEVFDYIVRKYGAKHVAQIITFGTMAARGAIKDVGRVMDMPYGEVDNVSKLIPTELGITIDRALTMNKDLSALYHDDNRVRKLIDISRALEGTPRHSSTHAAGVVIAPKNIDEFVPLQYSSENFITTQYDKDRVEELGLLKMDLLGLRTLTVIGDAVQMIKENRGIDLDIDKIPETDKKVADMFLAGDTAGIFQMESGGMTQLARGVEPQGFEDLIPLVALYRPGPLESGMANDFVNAKHGRQEIKSIHESVDDILHDTFGVILYQEQVMQIASAMAGFTLGQADILRRAMGKKKPEEMHKLKAEFISGAAKKGIEEHKAVEMFELIEHFAGYGFNKSHSAAYGLLAYQTAYLKANYTAEFMAAMLTSIMGQQEKVSYYIETCKSRGIAVLPPSINHSKSSFSVSGNNILFGLAGVKNVGENAVRIILQARENGRFESLVDLCERLDSRLVNRRTLESLIKCGALDEFGVKRSQMLAVLEQAINIATQKNKDAQSGQLGLFDDLAVPDEALTLTYPNIAELPPEEILALEKELIGFYVTGHPLDKYRDKLSKLLAITKLNELEVNDGANVQVGGLISACKKMFTKRGDAMAIFELEDFSGHLECVAFPKNYEQLSRYISQDAMIAVNGRVNIQDDKAKIIVEEITPLANYQQAIEISIDKQNEKAETLENLKAILRKFPGNDRVYLNFKTSRRRIKCADMYLTDGSSQQLLQEIRYLLGDNTVKNV